MTETNQNYDRMLFKGIYTFFFCNKTETKVFLDYFRGTPNWIF